jgi:hypothetical protein
MAFCAEKGALSGRIIDKATNLGIKDVNVVVVGSPSGAASTENGHYYIEHIVAGIYQLEFSAIGYHTVIIDSVIIESNEITSLDVSLSNICLEYQALAVQGADNHLNVLFRLMECPLITA